MAREAKNVQKAETDSLFAQQIGQLTQAQYLVLLWATQGEGLGVKYNLTNCFDDLKHAGITRTKQTAVAVVESVRSLCFIEIKDERNRKNIYITKWGAQALAALVGISRFQDLESLFLKEARQ
ncbi:MAG: hypothetical protein J6866_08605 [Victivallales bacterium]|nr:hypothetical protein [Victivallales bacterium]